MMAATDPGTGIWLVTVTTAEGRVVECAGDTEYVDDWLDEFSSADTLVHVERHEMTEAELEAYGPIWDSPGTAPEEDDERPLDDEEYA
jgi:hypothetical protein